VAISRPVLFDAIFKRLSAPERATGSPDDLQIAVAVLLIEAARMDDHFEAAERTVIERVLAAKFELSPEATTTLLEQGEEAAANSHQLYPFTRLAVEKMSPEQRVKLIEMLWEVAYADGVLDPEEDVLLRRVAGLIYVSDRDRVAARQRVLARMRGKSAN
jgi:uncharacterized tellurite resistance protein B-like protein